MAARFSLAKGNLALRRNDFDQANTQLNTAYHFFLFQNDSFGVSRSLLGLARLARLKGAPDDASSKLDEAQEGVKGRVSKKVEFLRGLIACEQAAVVLDRGEIDQAAELYTEASRLLKGTERGSYYGCALVGLADLKCAIGEFQDSLELYKEANTVFER